MKFSIDDMDHISVVHVQGDVTYEHAPELRKLANDKVAGATRDLVFVLNETEFVDSQGLETLLWVQERCGEKLGQLRLVGVTENVGRILHVTRLAPRFDIHADVESAVKSLRI